MGGKAAGEARAKDFSEVRRQGVQQLRRVDHAQDRGGEQCIEAEAQAAGVEVVVPEDGLLGRIGEGEKLTQGPANPSGQRHELASEAHGALCVAGHQWPAAGAPAGIGELDGVDVAGDDLVAVVCQVPAVSPAEAIAKTRAFPAKASRSISESSCIWPKSRRCGPFLERSEPAVHAVCWAVAGGGAVAAAVMDIPRAVSRRSTREREMLRS